MKDYEIGVLVDLVVNLARVDRTEPDSGNLRAGWHTDWLLTAVDEFVVVGKKDFAAYAEIGRQVLAQVGDLPETAALAQLAIFRGERKLPVSPERETALVQIIKNLELSIAALPDGTRKIRCQSLLKYHSGDFYSLYDHYDMAANAQKRAAEEMDSFGNQSGAAISRFMEVVYRLKQALCTGKPGEPEFQALEEKFTELTRAVRGTTLEAQWVECNGPMHLIEACIWLDQYHPKWDEWIASVWQGKKIGEAWYPLANLARAADLAKRGNPRAEEALIEVSKAEGLNENKAEALLILARRVILLGDRSRARELVNSMPVTGAQHVRAVAEKLFQ